MNHESGYWKFIQNSPWTVGGGVIVVMGGLCFWLLEVGARFLVDDISTSLWWKVFEVGISVLTGFFALCGSFCAYIYFSGEYAESKKTKKFTIIIPTAFFNEKILTTSEIRIFSSNGDAAKKLFIEFASGAALSKNLKIKILLRRELGNNQRDATISEQVQRWKVDIDNAMSKDGITVRTEFALYDSPVMLQGYIFDKSDALLSWYARSGNGQYRSPPCPPLFMLVDESEDMRKIIKCAFETFDFHFQKGAYNA